MYFGKKKKVRPRSDLRTRLEEYTAWKEQSSWFADEEKQRSSPGFFKEGLLIASLKKMHSFLFFKIIVSCLCVLVVFLFTFIKMPFSTALLEKIHFITTWEMDFREIGRQVLPAAKRMWEGNLENGLGQKVLAPGGEPGYNREALEGETAFFSPIEGELEKTFGLQFHPYWQREEMSYGIVFRPSQEKFVKASAGGIVKEVKEHPSYGLSLFITHALGMETCYGYLAEVLVKEGDAVEQGQHIAIAGLAPGDTKTALYFEMREKGRPLDPLPLLVRNPN